MGVIFPLSQFTKWEENTNNFLVRHLILLFWIVVHLVPFVEQKGTDVFLNY